MASFHFIACVRSFPCLFVTGAFTLFTTAGGTAFATFTATVTLGTFRLVAALTLFTTRAVWNTGGSAFARVFAAFAFTGALLFSHFSVIMYDI